mmetsp:Transcript_3501/g.3684  ORF Transcript_3501/g.3684 Transcript_3501/m.3684 type:complete len:82 (-) Transcript_3501:255-500(-)
MVVLQQSLRIEFSIKTALSICVGGYAKDICSETSTSKNRMKKTSTKTRKTKNNNNNKNINITITIRKRKRRYIDSWEDNYV